MTVASAVGAARRRRRLRPLDTVLWPTDAGFINITAAPYNADPTGAVDCTQIIRDAIAAAGRPTNFAPQLIYFPAGLYTVSDRILPVTPATRLCGAGKTKTTIRLANSSAGYGSAGTAKNVIEMGTAALKNSSYGNYVEHMTIEIGSGNPGAVALEGSMSNSGCMSHLRLLAPSGGLRGFTMLSTVGSGYIKDVTIEGFTRGIHGDTSDVNNYVFENLTIRNCATGIFGGRNWQFLDLLIENATTAIETSANAHGSVFILRSRLTRTGTAAGSAIIMPTKGFLYLRDLQAIGYSQIVTLVGANQFVGASAIKEWSSEDYWRGATKTAWTESETTYKSLNLLIKKAPEFHRNDFTANWQKVTTFTTAGIQAAVDAATAAGKHTVYVPYQGVAIDLTADVTIPNGSIRKVDLMFNRVTGTGRILVNSAGMVAVENADRLLVEHLGSGRTVIRNTGNTPSVVCAVGASGEVYVDNLGPHCHVKAGPGVSLWGRQLNREKNGQLVNDGGTYWLFGENFESLVQNDGTVVNPGFPTTNGGKTEIIGGSMDPVGGPPHPYPTGAGSGPIYSVTDGYLSVVQSGTWRPDATNGDPSYPWVIRDTWSAVATSLFETQAPVYSVFYVQGVNKRMLYPLYVSQQWPPT